MRLNVYGEIVRDEWLRTSNVRTNVTLDEYVVMPNHFHGILIITNDPCRGLARQAPTVPQFAKPQPDSLGTIIGAFKSAVTRRINTHRTERNLPIVHVWQRNYYERIIRDEKELFNTRRYIIENPMNWANDENHPNR